MTLGAAMHRTSLEVSDGPPIDTRNESLRRSDDAQRGSLALGDAMREQFFIFAIRHGVTIKDAELLCMNPVRLKSQKIWRRARR